MLARHQELTSSSSSLPQSTNLKTKRNSSSPAPKARTASATMMTTNAKRNQMTTYVSFQEPGPSISTQCKPTSKIGWRTPQPLLQSPSPTSPSLEAQHSLSSLTTVAA